MSELSRPFLNKIAEKYPAVIETIVGIPALVFLIYTMRRMLVFGEDTLVHDNVVWAYPLFHFFAENIVNGCLPFWNPFDHGGEPFYPILAQGRLLEPITLLRKL